MTTPHKEKPLDEGTLNSLIEGFQLISFDWRYLYVNRSVILQSKMNSKEDLLGYTMMEKFPGIDNTPLFKLLHKAMTERVSQNLENEFDFPDGSKGWFELRIQPVPEGIFILSGDITERKRAELEIKNHVKKMEEMMQMTSHRVRQPVAHILGISNLIDAANNTQSEMKKISGYMKDAAIALDVFTKELNDFMLAHKMDMQNPS